LPTQTKLIATAMALAMCVKSQTAPRKIAISTAFQILAKTTPTLTELLTPVIPAQVWLALATVAPQMHVAVAALRLTQTVTARLIALTMTMTTTALWIPWMRSRLMRVNL